MKTDVQQRDDILSKIDFDRIHQVMKKSGWQWAMDDGLRTPTVEELKERASEHIQAVQRGEWVFTGGGGLMAERFEDGTVALSFEVAHAISALD